METYHYAWLSVHKNRTEEWLKDRLADGFDIHHLDGNKANDTPTNLVLIECTDHMRLHGSDMNRMLNKAREAANDKSDITAKRAYDLKDRSTSWLSIGRLLYPDSLQPSALARNQAKRYADKNGLSFPKPNSNMLPTDPTIWPEGSRWG